jgi:hypothetical protein
MSMTMTRNSDAETRTQLGEFTERKKELRDQLAKAQAELDQARVAFASGDNSASVAAAEAANERDRIKQALEDVNQGHQALLGRVAPGGRAAGDGLDPSAVLSEQFADPQFLEQMRRLAGSSQNFGEMQIGEIPREAMARLAGGALQATATGGIVTPTAAMGVGPYGGIVPEATPATTFLDLVPAGTVDSPSLPFSQEIPETGDPGPAPAAPGTTKPAAGVGYQDATTASTTVAGWVKVNRQNLADVGQLQGAIQNRLLIKLRQSLEHQALSGAGTVSDVTGVPGIKGILQTTGIGSVDATGIAETPDAVLDGIVNLLASGATPNAIVLNINDWATLLKTKTGADNAYVASPFLSTARTLWDLAFIPSVAVTQGTAIVIDTARCMTLLFREGAHVVVGLDSDDLTKNRVTLLAECRAMLPIWCPAAACEVANIGAS